MLGPKRRGPGIAALRRSTTSPTDCFCFRPGISAAHGLAIRGGALGLQVVQYNMACTPWYKQQRSRRGDQGAFEAGGGCVLFKKGIPSRNFTTGRSVKFRHGPWGALGTGDLIKYTTTGAQVTHQNTTHEIECEFGPLLPVAPQPPLSAMFRSGGPKRMPQIRSSFGVLVVGVGNWGRP